MAATAYDYVVKLSVLKIIVYNRDKNMNRSVDLKSVN